MSSVLFSGFVQLLSIGKQIQRTPDNTHCNAKSERILFFIISDSLCS